MNYLILHIDVEFISAAVCTANGTTYPVTNGKEELLWLYFHNNPHQNTISFGKNNKHHFNNSEVNYYGKFFENIEKEIEKFTLRGREYPVIKLLKEAGLFETLRNAYQQITLDYKDKIPTLITFSSSVSDNAKQKTVDYLKTEGFQIDSYTIPIAELTCYHALNKKRLKVANGSIAIFMEASNSTLHLIKLTLSDNYFLKDGKTVSYRGKGLDPRKRALVRFIVNEVNNSTGVLSNEDEKEDEIDRLEHKADDWLNLLDVHTINKRPTIIRSVSFAKAPNMKKDVLVRKSDLDSDTGQYTQDLIDIYEAFRCDNVQGDVAAVFLLGNCFQSDRVKNGFKQLIGSDRLHLFANKDIHDVLAMYPKIDINRYASEEARIKARAEAEKQKQAQQRALEDKKRKEAEEEEKRKEDAEKAKRNREEAQRWFDRAVEFEKEGNLKDARTNAENALLLMPNHTEYQRFLTILKDKESELKIKTDQYKSLLNKAEKMQKDNDLESALHVYELAKEIFDSADIRNIILEIKGKIVKRKRQEDDIRILQEQEKQRLEQENKEKCEKIIIVADRFFNEEKWAEAKQQYEMALNLCPQEKSIKDKITQCTNRIKALEDAYNELLFEATVAEKKGDLKQALAKLESAEKLKPDNTDVKKKIKNIRFSLSFEQGDSVTITQKTPPKSNDGFLPPKTQKTDDNDFWDTKPQKKNTQSDDFVKKPQKTVKSFDDDDDFLGLNKKK